MGTVIDYLLKHGKYTFEELPMTEVDEETKDVLKKMFRALFQELFHAPMVGKGRNDSEGKETACAEGKNQGVSTAEGSKEEK